MTTCRNRIPCERCRGTRLTAGFDSRYLAIRCPACTDGTHGCGVALVPCPDCEPRLDGRRGRGFHYFLTPDGVEHTPTCRTCKGDGEVCPCCTKEAPHETEKGEGQ
jgi:hypothetical protein